MKDRQIAGTEGNFSDAASECVAWQQHDGNRVSEKFGSAHTAVCEGADFRKHLQQGRHCVAVENIRNSLESLLLEAGHLPCP